MAMKNHSTGNEIIVLSDKFHEEQIRSTKGGYPINPTIPKDLFGNRKGDGDIQSFDRTASLRWPEE